MRRFLLAWRSAVFTLLSLFLRELQRHNPIVSLSRLTYFYLSYSFTRLALFCTAQRLECRLLLESSSEHLLLLDRLLIKSIFTISPVTALHVYFSALANRIHPTTAPVYFTTIRHRHSTLIPPV